MKKIHRLLSLLLLIPLFAGSNLVIDQYAIVWKGDHAWTQQWYDRGLAQGIVNGFNFNVSETAITALDTFHTSLDDQGITQSQIYIVPRVGNNLSTSLVPSTVMGLTGSDIGTAVNFVEGDWDESVGLVGDGTSKYINWPVNPDDLGATAAFGLYIISHNTGDSDKLLAAKDSVGSTASGIISRSIVNNQYRAFYGISRSVNITRALGWVFSFRNALDYLEISIEDGTPITNTSSTTWSGCPYNFYEFAQNTDDSPAFYSDSTHGVMAIVLDPESWSATDQTVLYNAVVTFEGAIRP